MIQQFDRSDGGFPRLIAVARLFAIVAVLFFAGASGKGRAETRVGLVIGNGNYRAVARLPNPPRDAELIAKTLREVGFQSVLVLNDATREQFIDALHKFSAAASRADWAVIYFAGHGLELGGTNYLVPTDARLETDRDVQFEAVPLDTMLASVEGAKKMRLIILDACRDNPFVQRMKRSLSSRAIGRGLAHIEPSGGVLVVYSAKEGQIALDGEGQNSPFVQALAKHIGTPGLEINRLFRRVRGDVLAATNDQQEPFVYGSLPDEDFYFKIPQMEEVPQRERHPSVEAPLAPPPNKGFPGKADERERHALPIPDQSSKRRRASHQRRPAVMAERVKPKLPAAKCFVFNGARYCQ